MTRFFTIDDITEQIGLPKSRLRYIEARFPASFNRRLFDPDGRFYSSEHIKTFKELNNNLHENRFPETEKQGDSTQRHGKIIVFSSGK